MTRWGYCTAIIAGGGEVEVLDDRGYEGWDLVTVEGGIVYFKRPLEADPEES